MLKSQYTAARHAFAHGILTGPTNNRTSAPHNVAKNRTAPRMDASKRLNGPPRKRWRNGRLSEMQLRRPEQQVDAERAFVTESNAEVSGAGGGVRAEEQRARPQRARRRQSICAMTDAADLGGSACEHALPQDLRQGKDAVVVHHAAEDIFATRELIEPEAGQPQRSAERERLVSRHIGTEVGTAGSDEIQRMRSPRNRILTASFEALVVVRGPECLRCAVVGGGQVVTAAGKERGVKRVEVERYARARS